MTGIRTTSAIAIAVLLLVIVAATAQRASAKEPVRGTVQYCKQNAAGIAERACIVRVVWKGEGRRTANKAVRVFYCESTLNPRARNGRYWGIAQVSDDWRRDIPGFAWTTEAQARHALRVFRRVGSSFSPTWECA